MAADMESQMLELLEHRTSQITIADFARAFGANRELITMCSHRLVASGAAVGTFVERNGRPTLHALQPRPSQD